MLCGEKRPVTIEYEGDLAFQRKDMTQTDIADSHPLKKIMRTAEVLVLNGSYSCRSWLPRRTLKHWLLL